MLQTAKPHIFPQGQVKEIKILKKHTDKMVDAPLRVFLIIFPVKKQFSFVRPVKVCKKLDQRGFSAAITSHQRNGFPLFDLKIQSVENLIFPVIGKTQALPLKNNI